MVLLFYASGSHTNFRKQVYIQWYLLLSVPFETGIYMNDIGPFFCLSCPNSTAEGLLFRKLLTYGWWSQIMLKDKMMSYNTKRQQKELETVTYFASIATLIDKFSICLLGLPSLFRPNVHFCKHDIISTKTQHLKGQCQCHQQNYNFVFFQKHRKMFFQCRSRLTLFFFSTLYMCTYRFVPFSFPCRGCSCESSGHNSSCLVELHFGMKNGKEMLALGRAF